VNRYKALENSIVGLSPTRPPLAIACEASFKNMNNWLKEARATHASSESSILLDGALCASIEVTSTAYLGLIRQSISSLRVYYELNLSWLYYKDHPIEWAKLTAFNEQASLPGEVQKYLKNYLPKYEARWSVLEKKKLRAWDEPYKIMSSFVHGNMLGTLPNARNPAEIIVDDDKAKQLPNFISSVCEYIGDAYVSSSLHNWESLPPAIRARTEARLGKTAKAILDFT